MRTWAVALALAALSLAVPSRASVVVDVLVAGPSDYRYELSVGRARRRGRLAPASGGVVSTLESIEVPAAPDSVSAAVIFFGDGGVVSRCAPVLVPVRRSAAGCSPAFVVQTLRPGLERMLCQSSCQPARRAGR